MSRLGDWCAGSCCASCVRFVLAVLFPLFWTVIQHGCWVRLLIGSLTLCGWGSIPLLSARVPRVVGWVFPPCLADSRGLLSFPCLGYVWAALRVVWVGALPCWGVFGWFPFTCGWAVISALRAAREHTPPGVWLLRVVALVAYAVSGCPCGCAWLVRLRGFPCTLARGVFRWVCARVAVCPHGCLFVGCALLYRVLLVCCCLCCLVDIVWCAFRECSRSYCDMVHAGWCGCAFDGDLGCRLLFTV